MNFQPGWIESAEFANVSSSQQSKSHPDPTVNSLYSNPERRYFSGRDIDYAKFVHYSGVISPEQVLPGDDARYSKEKIHVDQWPLPEDLCPLTQPESKVLESQQATGPSDALLTMLDDSNIIFQFDLDESFDAINKNLSENFQTLVESVTDEVDWNNFGDDYRQLTSAIHPIPIQSQRTPLLEPSGISLTPNTSLLGTTLATSPLSAGQTSQPRHTPGAIRAKHDRSNQSSFSVWDAVSGQNVETPAPKRQRSRMEKWETAKIRELGGACASCKKNHRRCKIDHLIPLGAKLPRPDQEFADWDITRSLATSYETESLLGSFTTNSSFLPPLSEFPLEEYTTGTGDQFL